MIERRNTGSDENPYSSPKEIGDPPSIGKDAQFRRAGLYAALQQVIVLVLATLVLDGGDLYRLTIIAALLSWLPIVFVGCLRFSRKQNAITKLDTVIIRHSFWVFLVGMYLLYHFRHLPDSFYHFH